MSEIKKIKGTLKRITKIKGTKRPERYMVSLNIEGFWFNMFGQKEELERKTAVLMPLQDVEASYVVNTKNGKEFYNIIDIKIDKQKGLSIPGVGVATNNKSFAPLRGGDDV